MPIPVRNSFIGGILILLACGCSETDKEAYRQLEQENTQLVTKLDSLSQQLDSLLTEQNAAHSPANRNVLLNEGDIAYFRKRGLTDPVEAIKADLTRNNQLIPVKGSLGGTMQFYKDRIHILNRQWVLAYFEDGHNAGEMLLEYKVNTNGSISWKVLSTSMM